MQRLSPFMSKTLTTLNKPSTAYLLASSQRNVMGTYPQRSFRQVNNLHEIIYTA